MAAYGNYMEYYENSFYDGQVATPRNVVENVGSQG